MSDGLRQRADAAAQVVVDDLDHLEVTNDDFHHLSKVLRLRAGETVSATDGKGSWRLTVWRDGLAPTGSIQFEPQLLPLITVGFALTKGDKPELAVQKLTEIGVDVIRPVIAVHTIVKWDDAKRAANVERFRRVAYEAAMQSRRVWMPLVTEIVALSDVDASDRVLAEAGGEALSLERPTVFVGPEGGWSSEELAGALSHIDLGPTILRAETAALVVAGRLASERWQRSSAP